MDAVDPHHTAIEEGCFIERLARCTDTHGQVEQYGLFELRRVEEDEA